MGHRKADDSGSRFAAYVEKLVEVIGHADRARPLRDYCGDDATTCWPSTSRCWSLPSWCSR
jgi:SRSO17 transposase